MGWWQGHLLRGEIRDLLQAWPAALVRGQPGEVAEALDSGLPVFLEERRRRLPERLRQELEGIAAGAGVDARDLLALTLRRDVLRFQGVSAHLLRGDLVVAPRGPRARLALHGDAAAFLADRLLVVERRPDDGSPRSLVVAWPGSLGGIAGVSATGLGALAAEVDAPIEGQRLGDLPPDAQLRLAIEARGGREAAAAEGLGGATARRVVLLDGPARAVLLVQVGVAAAVEPVPELAPALLYRDGGETPEVLADADAGFDALLEGGGGPWIEASREGDALQLRLARDAAAHPITVRQPFTAR